MAASLDGFIAKADGGHDWIPMDPDIDFGALFAEYDTLLMGRGTWDGALKDGSTDGGAGLFGMRTVVVSNSLPTKTAGNLSFISGEPASLSRAVAQLKAEPGKDIWLFGGGKLCATLLDAGLVDTVEPAVCPIVLGSGIPMIAPTAQPYQLALEGQRTYEKSGIVLSRYRVVP